MLRSEATPVERFHEARKLMQERFRLEGDLDDFYNLFNICIHKVLTRGLGVPVVIRSSGWPLVGSADWMSGEQGCQGTL